MDGSRSLTARESTAAAERWRYIQSVLERRRRESLERRERFIRQPIENIIRQKAAQQNQHVQHWSNMSRRSILKKQSGQQPDHIDRLSKWIQRRVRFHVRQDEEQSDPDDDFDGERLPALSLPEELNRDDPMVSSVTANNDDGMRRLPPLLGSLNPSGIFDPEPARPSWVERQVAKVRQRKLWAQQQENQNKTACPAGPANVPAGTKVLKRTVSLLVNVSDESDSGSVADDDSLDEDRWSGQPEWPIPRSGQRYLAWEVRLDKEETAKEKEKLSDPIPDAYGGWPHFPIRLASGIKGRQESLREKRAGRRKSTSRDSDSSNSFIRRKRFSKSLLMAVIRLKTRNTAKRASVIHQTSTGHSSGNPSKPENLPIGGIGPITFENRHFSKEIHQEQGSFPSLPDIPEEIADPESEGQSSLDRCDPDDSDLIRMLSNSSLDLTNRGKDEILPEESVSWSIEAGPIMVSSPVPSVSQPTESDPVDQDPVDIGGIEESIHPESISVVDGLGGATCNLHSCDPQGLEPLTSQLDWPAGVQAIRVVKAEWEESIDNGAGLAEEEEEWRLKNLSTDPVAAAQSDGPVTRVQSGQPARLATVSHISTTAGRAGSPVTCQEGGLVIQQSVQQEDQVVDDEGLFLSARDGQSGRETSLSTSFNRTAWSVRLAERRPVGNQDIPSNPSFQPNGFEALTSEERVASNGPKSSINTLAAGLETEDHVLGQPSGSWLDKKTKEARNVLRMSWASIATQTEPYKPAFKLDEPASIKNDVDKSMTSSSTSSSASSAAESSGSESCHCLHRAVLTCLLPEAADTLASLELIRRQLKKARIRGQQQEHPSHPKTRHGRQPLSARLDVSQTRTQVSGSDQKEAE